MRRNHVTRMEMEVYRMEMEMEMEMEVYRMEWKWKLDGNGRKLDGNGWPQTAIIRTKLACISIECRRKLLELP